MTQPWDEPITAIVDSNGIPIQFECWKQTHRITYIFNDYESNVDLLQGEETSPLLKFHVLTDRGMNCIISLDQVNGWRLKRDFD